MMSFLEASIQKTMRDHQTHPFRFSSEHGWHARMVHHMYMGGPPSAPGVDWIQSEYPTGSKLQRSRSQNWDIAILGPGTEVRAIIEVNLKSGVELNTIYEDVAKKWTPRFTWKTSHLLDDLERMSENEAGVSDLHAVEFWEGKSKMRDEAGSKWHWDLLKRAMEGKDLFSRDEWVQLLVNEEHETYERYRDSGKTPQHLEVRKVERNKIEDWTSKVNIWLSIHRANAYGAFALKKGASRFVSLKFDGIE